MPDNRLDEQIKKQLARYEAAFDPKDWDRMEVDLAIEDGDSAIRNKLADYAVPFNAGSWDEMAAQLDAPFDTYVRKKLGRFSVPYNPADWARLSRLLDDSLESSIRARLEEHEAPFSPASDWPLMVEALASPFDDAIREKFDGFSTDEAIEQDWELIVADMAPPFDQAVYRKLATHEAQYHAMEWMRMEALLDAKDDDDGVLWYFRWQNYAVAASFLLIAMLSVGGVNVLMDRIWNPQDIAEVITLPPDEGAAEPRFQQEKSAIAQADQLTETTVEANTQAASENTSLSSTADDAESTTNLVSTIPAVVPNDHLIQPIDPDISMQPVIAPPTATLTSLESLIPHSAEDGQSSEHQSVAEESHQVAAKKAKGDIALKAISHTGNPVMLGFFQSDLNGFLGGKVPNMATGVNIRHPEIRLGLYLATTHSVAELNDMSKPGFGAGLRAEVRFDEEWSIVSGLLFTHKQFSHKYYIFADDRTQWENILDADFHALEVPVLVKYRFPRSGKVQVYAQAGLATMVTLEEKYLRYNPLSFENADRISRSVDKSQHIPTNQTLTLNTYVGNIQAAAGIEYEVSDHLSLQLEPYFQWGLQPMGTEQKPLHSLGVGTALVYTFGNKSS